MQHIVIQYAAFCVVIWVILQAKSLYFVGACAGYERLTSFLFC